MTTRDQRSCPEGIVTAYDRDKFRDDSFAIACDTNVVELTTSFDLFAEEVDEDDVEKGGLESSSEMPSAVLEDKMSSDCSLMTGGSNVFLWAVWMLCRLYVHM